MGFFKTKKTTVRNMPVQLTGLGKQRAERSGWKPIDKVLVSLQENGPSSVNEIAEDTRLPRGKVEVLVRKCVSQGYCKQHGGEAED